MLKQIFLICCVGIALAITAVLFSLPTPDRQLTAAVRSSDLVLISNATVFNGSDFIDNIDVEIANGRFKAIGPNLSSAATARIDGSGKTLIPGLIDAHTHSYGDALRTAINYGVTTHVDMFTSPSQLQTQTLDQSSSNIPRTEMFSAGMLATVEGGHGAQFGVDIETLNSPEQASAWVLRRIDEGSDFIKLVYMPYSNYFNSLDRDTARAIIQAAHRNGMKAVAHISSQRPATELLEDGIDGLVHIFADQEISNEFLSLAKDKDIFVIPTLSVIAAAANENLAEDLLNDLTISDYLTPSQTQQLKANFGSTNIPGFDLQLATFNVKRLHEAGISILAGSDAPNPGTTYGASIHQELELLNSAGLTSAQAINAASYNVARAFDLQSSGTPIRGRIIAGAKADFIMLKASPETNIKATRQIVDIYQDGVSVERITTGRQAAKLIVGPDLSNFGSGLNTSNGLIWSTTDDSMVGGASSAAIQTLEEGLQINSTVKHGFVFPWAGAAVFGEHRLDISHYSTLSFKVRGSVGEYRAMVFSGSNTGIPPSQTFVVRQEWQNIELPLSKFRGFDPRQFLGLAIVAGPTTGEFELYLDDVKLRP